MRPHRSIGEKVDLAERMNDAAGPGLRLARGERARPLTTQGGRHVSRQLAVLGVQVLLAKLVRQAHDSIVGCLQALGTGFRPIELGHPRPSSKALKTGKWLN